MMNIHTTDDTINVVILGNTGEGKSTLINSVLNLNVSMTGVGDPVTQEIFSYKVPRSQLRLFDTKGFEVEASQETVDAVDQFINERSKDTNINKRVHCVWLCVSAQSSRWQKVQQKFIHLCSELNIPCIVTVTQSYGDYEQYVEFIQANVPKDVLVIPLLAKALGLPDGSTIDPWGINGLIEQTSSLGNSFKVRLAEKKARSERELAEQKALLKKKETREKASLARKQAFRQVSSIVKKTIGGTISALGLLIALAIFTTFEKCEGSPGFWSWLTNRAEYDAATARHEQCSSQNSTRTGILVVFLSGTAFVIWFTFIKGEKED